jgi:hypothetical protein
VCQPEVPAKSLQAGDHFINRKYYACAIKLSNTPPFGLQALHQVLNLAQNAKHIRMISPGTFASSLSLAASLEKHHVLI